MNTSSLLRRLVIFGAPLSYLVIGAIHPMELRLGDDPDLYIGIHIVQLFSIWGMAAAMWFLTEGIDNRAARIARSAILPYAIFYSAFDAIAGIAVGWLVLEGNGMGGIEGQALQTFIDNASESLGFGLFFAANLAWLVAAISTALSLRGTVPGGAVALMVTSAVIFAVGHPFPTGPIAMTLLLAGLTWVHVAAAGDDNQYETSYGALEGAA